MPQSRASIMTALSRGLTIWSSFFYLKKRERNSIYIRTWLPPSPSSSCPVRNRLFSFPRFSVFPSFIISYTYDSSLWPQFMQAGLDISCIRLSIFHNLSFFSRSVLEQAINFQEWLIAVPQVIMGKRSHRHKCFSSFFSLSLSSRPSTILSAFLRNCRRKRDKNAIRFFLQFIKSCRQLCV